MLEYTAWLMRGAQAVDGGDDHDVAGMLKLHLVGGLDHAEHGADVVGVDQRLDVLQSGVRQLGADVDARVSDEDVQAAVFSDIFFEKPLLLTGAGNVHDIILADAAGFLDEPVGFFKTLGGTAEQRHLSAEVGQGYGDGSPDPGAGAGDDGLPAVQTEQFLYIRQIHDVDSSCGGAPAFVSLRTISK